MVWQRNVLLALAPDFFHSRFHQFGGIAAAWGGVGVPVVVSFVSSSLSLERHKEMRFFISNLCLLTLQKYRNGRCSLALGGLHNHFSHVICLG